MLRYTDEKTYPRAWIGPWVKGGTIYVQGLLFYQVSNTSDLILDGNFFGLGSQYLREQNSDAHYFTKIPRF